MAAWTAASSSFDTNSGTHTVTLTPAVGDLPVFVIANTGVTGSTMPTDNNADGLGTGAGAYVLARSSNRTSGANVLEFWVRANKIGNASSTIFSHAPGVTTGGGFVLERVTGMSKAGTLAIRKVGGESSIAVNATPAPSWDGGGSGLTGNPKIGAVNNSVNPATMTKPASFDTERADIGYTTPATGLQVVTDDSGNTDSTVTWGSTSTGGQHCSLIMELDASPNTQTVNIGEATETDTATVAGRNKAKTTTQPSETDRTGVDAGADVVAISQATGGSTLNLTGAGGSNEMHGQRFSGASAGAPCYVSGADIYFFGSVGSPPDSVLVELVDSDITSGTVLASATMLASSIVANSFNRFTFTSVAIASGTDYFIRISRTGTTDNSNRASPAYNPSDVFASGERQLKTSGTWAATTGDLRFRVITTSPVGLGKKKSKAVTQASDTETANASRPNKLKPITQPSTTNTANALTKTRSRTLTQASETDTANALAKTKSKAVAEATETDTATVAAHTRQRAVGQASETDTANALSRQKRRTVGLASEQDLAPAISHTRQRAVTQASESDTANAATRLRSHAIGQPSETATAAALSHTRARTLTEPAEANTANAVARTRSRTLTQATETDAAIGVGRSTRRSITQAQETDTAAAVSHLRSFHIGQASETDSAFAVTRLTAKTIAIGEAVETDTVPASPSRAKFRSIGLADETDTASPVTILAPKFISIGLAQETDTAAAVGFSHPHFIGQALETDTAGEVTLIGGIAPPPVVPIEVVGSASDSTAAPDVRIEVDALDSLLPLQHGNTLVAVVVVGGTGNTVTAVTSDSAIGPDFIEAAQVPLPDLVGPAGSEVASGGGSLAVFIRPVAGDEVYAWSDYADTATGRMAIYEITGLIPSPGDLVLSDLWTWVTGEDLDSTTTETLVNDELLLLAVAWPFGTNDPPVADYDRSNVQLSVAAPDIFGPADDQAADFLAGHPYDGGPEAFIGMFVLADRGPVRVAFAGTDPGDTDRDAARFLALSFKGGVLVARSFDVGVASETDTAGALSRARTFYVASEATEIATANPLTYLRAATIGEAVETDTVPGVLSHTRAVPIGLAFDSNEAVALGRQKTKAVGLASETDTALAIAHFRQTAVGLASETETAPALSPVNKRNIVTEPSETDTAALSAKFKSRTLTQAQELDTAGPVGGVRIIPIGGVAETDTVAPLGAAFKSRTATQVTEADSATALVHTKVRAIGRASGTEVANPLVATKRRAVGLALETDTATVSRPTKLKPTTQPSETDTATTLVHRRSLGISQPVETDSAAPASFSNARFIGISQAIESDTALLLHRSKSKATGQASESDTANPVTFTRPHVIGQATETDTATTAARVKSRTTTQATETDTATAAAHVKRRTLGQAIEADTANVIRPLRSRNITQASETDTALGVGRTRSRILAEATETDSATVLSHRRARGISQASESDTANVLRPLRVRNIGQAAELDIAQALKHARRRAIAQARETDTALRPGLTGGLRLSELTAGGPRGREALGVQGRTAGPARGMRAV